jgi:prepilin-type N-terminal cleavage/methylation domain-containing protein
MLRRIFRKIRGIPADGRVSAPGREGFTLVEIMMVLMILTVGVLPIAVIQHRSREQVSEADRATQAIQLAQMHLERTKGLGFGNAVDSAGQTGQINWAVTVTNVAFGLDRVQVTTTWQNDGAQETLTISDLMSTR